MYKGRGSLGKKEELGRGREKGRQEEGACRKGGGEGGSRKGQGQRELG